MSGRGCFVPDNALTCEHIDKDLLEGQVGREHMYPFSISQTVEINTFLSKILVLTDEYLQKRDKLASVI